MKRIICMIGIFLLLQCFAEINFNESTSNFELKFSCENNTRYRFWDSDDLILWNYNYSFTSSVNSSFHNIEFSIQTNNFKFFKIDLTPPPPEREWFVNYNGIRENKESHGHFILTCNDGGFIQIGESGSPYDSGRILVIKTDSLGNLLWKQETDLYISGRYNLGNSVIETDDGYVIFGAQSSGGSSTQNSLIAKLNKSDGSIIFINSINNGQSDAFEHGVQTENGFIAVGYKNAEDPQNTFHTEGQGLITFLDTYGQKTGELDVNNYLAQAYRIFALSDGYVISGQTAETLQFGVIKLSLNGNIEWFNDYGFESNNGSSEYDHCFGMAVGNNDTIYLTGHTQYLYEENGAGQSNNWDTLTIKIDKNGNELWKKRKGNPRGFDPRYIHDEAWGICTTTDGGCIIVAGSGDEYSYSEINEDDNSNQWVVYVIKYTSDGIVEWEKTFKAENEDEGFDWAGEDIALTSDGNAIIAVDNGTFGFLKISLF